MTDVIRHSEREDYRLRGVGIVVGSLINPDGIANEHIRIHALEGRLFRGVVEDAVVRRQLAYSVWRNRDLYGVGVEVFGRSETMIRARLAALGKSVSGSWVRSRSQRPLRRGSHSPDVRRPGHAGGTPANN